MNANKDSLQKNQFFSISHLIGQWLDIFGGQVIAHSSIYAYDMIMQHKVLAYDLVKYSTE